MSNKKTPLSEDQLEKVSGGKAAGPVHVHVTVTGNPGTEPVAETDHGIVSVTKSVTAGGYPIPTPDDQQILN